MKSKQQSEAAPASGQHTPGPWRVNGDAIFDSCGNRISTAFQPFYRRGNEPQQNLSDLQAANARLIASAPALLEALKVALAVMMNGRAPSKRQFYCYNWMVEPLEPCDCSICKVRAAIAQAEGRVAE